MTNNLSRKYTYTQAKSNQAKKFHKNNASDAQRWKAQRISTQEKQCSPPHRDSVSYSVFPAFISIKVEPITTHSSRVSSGISDRTPDLDGDERATESIDVESDETTTDNTSSDDECEEDKDGAGEISVVLPGVVDLAEEEIEAAPAKRKRQPISTRNAFFIYDL